MRKAGFTNFRSQVAYPELGFPHRAGRYRAGGSPLSSPVRWSCICMERFMIRGWGLLLPGCSGAPMSPHNQSAVNQWCSSFLTVLGGIDQHRFRPWFVGDVDLWNDLRSRDGNLSPTSTTERNPANQQSPRGGGASTPYGPVSSPGTIVFIPGLSELQI